MANSRQMLLPIVMDRDSLIPLTYLIQVITHA